MAQAALGSILGNLYKLPFFKSLIDYAYYPLFKNLAETAEKVRERENHNGEQQDH